MSEGTDPSLKAIDDAGQVPAASREYWVVGTVSLGHWLSHFYFLALPPLFPVLKDEFGVGYVELGSIMTAYVLLGGLAQAPVGVLVDRFGARPVLLFGLAMNAGAFALMGLADGYWALLVLALIGGLGNSVFHPADYAILSDAISPSRLGRAFSIHTFAGFLGSACAPVIVLALTSLMDWRAALTIAGIVGLLACAGMALRRDLLGGGNSAPDKPRAAESTSSGQRLAGLRSLLSPAVLLFLGFFILYGMTSGGLTAFTVSALVDLHGIALEWANRALTGHLFGVVGGILLAGLIADRYPRHMVTAAGALIVAASAVVLPALVSTSEPVLVAAMILAGVGMGAVLPPRDLMVRAIVPSGQSGTVFGFIFVGYAIGGSLSPLLFGWFLDNGLPAMLFVIAAGLALVALAVIGAARFLSPR